MKTKIIIFTYILTIIVHGCKDLIQNKEIDCLTVVIDTTNPSQPKSVTQADMIFSRLRLSNNPLYGAKINIMPVTNLRFNKTSSFYLESENKMNSNEFERNALIFDFKQDIDSCLSTFNKEVYGTDGSYIFFTIANAISELATCEDCNTKTLIVFSDLQENTSSFSVYSPRSLALIRDSSQAMMAFMDREYPLKSELTGIKIYLEFHPKNGKDDEKFYIVSHFLQEYYKSKGALVFINASPGL